MDSRTPIAPAETEPLGPGFKPRRNQRHGIEGEAQLAPETSCKIQVKVRNLSTSGFMAECAEPVQIGSYVALDVPGVGKVDAQIRWQIGNQMGGMFLDPISLSQCEWTAIKA